MKAANKSIPMIALGITDGLILLVRLTKFRYLSGTHFCVANPVLRQWINIPKLPYDYFGFRCAALVTHMNNGDLLGYKVVSYVSSLSGVFYFQIYSSDSGNWTHHNISELHLFELLPSGPINLNGCLHWLCRATKVIFALDFYAPTELSYVIHLPQKSSFQPISQATLTISCESLMYMYTDDTGRPEQQLKIWRLKNYTSGSSKESWEFLWNLRSGLEHFVGCAPAAMHPFDKEVVYLVNRQTHACRLVIGNLRTKKFQLHKEWKHILMEYEDYEPRVFHQFVIPQRLGSIPCPPGCTLVTLPDNPDHD